jgi:hypothetical protein
MMLRCEGICCVRSSQSVSVHVADVCVCVCMIL